MFEKTVESVARSVFTCSTSVVNSAVMLTCSAAASVDEEAATTGAGAATGAATGAAAAVALEDLAGVAATTGAGAATAATGAAAAVLRGLVTLAGAEDISISVSGEVFVANKRGVMPS